VSERAADRPHQILYVLGGGLIAGTLDIAYAWLFWSLRAGVTAQRIFQSVAAGLLGRESFAGGARTAALGLGLHFFIATTMSIVYFLVARRVELLRRRVFLCGASYGLLLYAVMNYVVLPLSAAGRGSREPLWVVLSILVHIFFVGVPIAFAASRALKD
jgi:hypothetical protein